MPVNQLLILEIIALLLMLLLGVWLLLKTPSPDRRLFSFFYLQCIALLLLFIVFSLPQGLSILFVQPVYAGLILCSPLILGLLVFIFHWIFHRISVLNAQNPLSIFLLCFAIFGLLAALLLQPYGLFLALLPGAILLTCLGLFAGYPVVKEILLSLLFVLFMGISSSAMSEMMLESLPEWLDMTLRPVLFLQAGYIVAWSAWLTYRAVDSLVSQARTLDPGNLIRQRFTAYLQLGVSTFMLVSLIYTVFWVSLWDHTDNGLGGVWLAITGSFLSIAAGGILLERKLPGMRLAGMIYLVPVTLLIWAAFGVGMRIPYHPISDQRAALIVESIQEFYTQNRRYPTSLAELVPDQLLWVPRQLVLRNEDWCYQGGEDYFRLGVFWRDRFSGLLEPKTYASQGAPPEAGWACQELLVQMKFKYDPSPFFGGGQ